MSVAIDTLILSLVIGFFIFSCLVIFWNKKKNSPLGLKMVKDSIIATLIIMFFVSVAIFSTLSGREEYQSNQEFSIKAHDIARSFPTDLKSFENKSIHISGPIYIYDLVGSTKISPYPAVEAKTTDEEFFFFIIVNKSKYFYSIYQDAKILPSPVLVYGEDIEVVVVEWPSKKIMGAQSIHGMVPERITVPDRPINEYTFPATSELDKWISSISS
jgi:hypothetical protein